MRRPTTISFLLLLSLLMVAAPSRAASPMIQGRAWVDLNCDGIYQNTEPPATYAVMTSSPYLYRFGPDGAPFTGDDRQLRPLSVADTGVYEDATDSAIMPAERYRLSILQGGRPAGYLPTLYRRGGDPARWSSLEANWTTTGFLLDPSGAVTGGNIGIAPASCAAQWYPFHVFAPLLQS